MPLPKIIPKIEAEPVRKMASVSLTPKAETGPNLGRIPGSAGYQYLLRLQKFFQKTESEMVWKVSTRAKVFSYGGIGMATVLMAMCGYTLGSFVVGKKD